MHDVTKIESEVRKDMSNVKSEEKKDIERFGERMTTQQERRFKRKKRFIATAINNNLIALTA